LSAELHGRSDMDKFAKFLDRVSFFSTIYGLLPSSWQTAAIALASAAIGFFGYQSGTSPIVGIFYAGVGAAVVFGMGMMGVFFTLAIARQLNIFQRLSVRDIGVTDFGVELRNGALREIKHLTMNFTLQNNSERNIFFKCLRGDLAIMGIVNQHGTIDATVKLVPARKPHILMFSTFPLIAVPEPVSVPGPTPIIGKVELEIAYGPRPDKLPYLLSYLGEPSLGYAIVSQGNGKGQPQVQIKIITAVKRYIHKRRRYDASGD
jgi:hypothetical protein